MTDILFEIKYWLTHTKWKRNHGWKKEFDIIEIKICTCGQKYTVRNGYIEETLCEIMNHIQCFHPKKFKEICKPIEY